MLDPVAMTTTITLAVPSGKIIVTDDLRPVYDWDDTGFASYNTPLGQSQAITAMAEIGCAYGPCGNTCPGLYRTGPDTYVIAWPGYIDGTDEPKLPEDDRLAGIITDLWAYSIADYEHWVARGGRPDRLDCADTIVDVTPGIYQFAHRTGQDHYAAPDDTMVFAHITRIA